MIKFILGVAGFAFALWCLNDYMSQPDVFKSYSKNKCVKIIDYKGNEMPCSELGKYKRYNLVWVE